MICIDKYIYDSRDLYISCCEMTLICKNFTYEEENLAVEVGILNKNDQLNYLIILGKLCIVEERNQSQSLICFSTK